MNKYIKIVLAAIVMIACSKDETTEKEVFTVSENQVTLTDLQIKNSGIETNILNNLNEDKIFYE